MVAKAFISGCASTRLSAEERRFFADTQPWGLIVFARNCETADQINALCAEFREAVGRADAPVLIDQEGGRVQRICEPMAPRYPAGAIVGALWGSDRAAAKRCAWLAGRLIGEDLFSLGITVDCLPVLDISFPSTHEVIGDRALGDSAEAVTALGGAMADGLMEAGVAPVGKHMPGHGRARVDSHFELPVVETSTVELKAADFAPFRQLSSLPMMMTAHLVYTSLDPDQPATLSAPIINDIIRNHMGFGGLLMTDDLSMKALEGTLGDRASVVIAAGCDMALHCNGEPDEMRAVADNVPPLEGVAAERAERALVSAQRVEADMEATRAEFDALIGRAGTAHV